MESYGLGRGQRAPVLLLYRGGDMEKIAWDEPPREYELTFWQWFLVFALGFCLGALAGMTVGVML